MLELALSLAVIGFAMVSIMGLLAVGLNISRDAGDDHMASQIAQAIMADCQGASFQTNKAGLSSTTFQIPDFDIFTNVHMLYFGKDGGMPSMEKEPKSYYAVEICTNPPPVKVDGMAFVDVRVSWPASSVSNRTSYYYSTVVTRR
ncbi:MAG: hypothetical protein PHV34_15440 [Verrucomicrobiae bacterium]|nr:hypothetical protein [Verrucomicrobiae bacterium]